jgi:hypothetical protein
VTKLVFARGGDGASAPAFPRYGCDISPPDKAKVIEMLVETLGYRAALDRLALTGDFQWVADMILSGEAPRPG